MHFLLVLLLAALTPLPTLAQKKKKGTHYALLVGVNEYSSGHLRKLKYAERDVTELAQVLTQKAGFRKQHVILMTKTQSGKDLSLAPEAKKIRRLLKKLVEVCEENDTLILSFAGHGAQFKGETKHYFCPADAELNDRSTMLDLDKDVYQVLKEKCKARVKLLLVDACRSDPRNETGRAARKEIDLQGLNDPQRLKRPKGIMAFFSCRAGQESHEEDELKHGIFFHFVIEGLKGKAAGRDGVVTVSELKSFVRQEVKTYTLRKSYSQIPELREESEDVIALIEQAALVKEITNSIGMKLRLIPTGTFMMGSPKDEKKRESNEGPQHEVEITKPFYMGVYEVTQAKFKEIMGYNPSYFSRDGKEKAGAPYYSFSKPAGGKKKIQGLITTSFPVENVSWNEAVEFCKKLSDLTSEKRAGRVYRLPTEAEWEYACRGGSKKYRVFAFGNSLSSKQANFSGGSPYGKSHKGINLERTCKVGSYPPNEFGLYDMHGNVFEWCNDFYSDKTYTKNKRKDPTGPNMGKGRSSRGGAWLSPGFACRSASRSRDTPTIPGYVYGFRVVLEVK